MRSRDVYPLTYAQLAMWNIEQFYPGIGVNNISGSMIYTEDIDFNILTNAKLGGGRS